MVRVKRLQVTAHLGDPCASFFPATGDALSFVQQLVTKDSWIVAIHRAGDAVATRGDLLDMLTIESARSFIGVELHRDFVVDAERSCVVVSAIDSGPTQVLRHASCVAPPISETKLHAQSVARGFSQHLIEEHELSFVPFVRLVPKRMRAWPIVEVLNWIYIIRAAFARSPHAHDFDSYSRCLLECLRHARAIFVAIQHRNIRADKAKRPTIDYKTKVIALHKARATALTGAAPVRDSK